MGSLIQFQGFGLQQEPSVGSESWLRLFRTLTRGHLVPSAPTPEPLPGRDQTKWTILAWVARVYEALTPWGFLLAWAGFLLVSVNAALQRKLSYPFVIITAVGLGVAVRVVLLAMIDISSFFALNPLYLAPAYPLFLLFVAMGIISLGKESRQLKGRLCSGFREQNASPCDVPSRSQ
jgi:hypothetical protein